MLQIGNSTVQNHPHGLDAYRRVYGIRKDLSALAEIKTGEIKTKNMKRKRLLGKYNTEEENLDHVMTEL
jgi:hypothetical protein